LGLLFKVVVGAELLVGAFALLRPRRGWPLVALLLLIFGGVLVSQVTAGAASCGCFGATIKIPPAAMLAVDASMLALLLAARPWGLARGGSRADAVAAVAALALAIAAPIAIDREGGAPAAGAATGRPALRPWVALEVGSWVGKPLAETTLARHANLEGLPDGLWLVYRDSCEVCADCLRTMSVVEQGARELVLVRLREPADPAHPPKVHDLPKGPFVWGVELPDSTDWVVTAPARLFVENGIVVGAQEGIDASACR
jgi:hypothetical protein